MVRRKSIRLPKKKPQKFTFRLQLRDKDLGFKKGFDIKLKKRPAKVGKRKDFIQRVFGR